MLLSLSAPLLLAVSLALLGLVLFLTLSEICHPAVGVPVAFFINKNDGSNPFVPL